MIKTLKDVSDAVDSNISEILDQLNIDCSNDVDDIVNAIDELLDSNGFDAPDVIYYHEAWGVVAGSDFNDYDPDVSFEGCANSLDCVMREANEIVCEAYYALKGECVQEVAEGIYEVIETILEVGGDESLNLAFSGNPLYGWAPHNRETENGIAIYDDAPGYYNPKKLEGELYAVEGRVNGVHVSACWNPDDYE